MKYCPRCKIDVAPSHVKCPLCGTALKQSPERSELDTSPVDYPGRDDPVPADLPSNDSLIEAVAGLSPRERCKVAIELISVACGFGLAVPLLVNLFIEQRLSWSLWSSVGVALLWAVTTLPLLFWRRPWLLFSTLIPSVLALIASFDLIGGSLDWFLLLGGPLVLLVSAVITSVTVLFRTIKRHGLNVVGLFVASCAVLVVGIELIVDFYLERRFSPSWSIVTALALIPTSGFLFYLHYRVVNRASLRKLFRL